MADTPLTAYLLSLSTTTKPFTRATTHPFLTQAGAGTLPSSTLTQWLVQDIHYTRGYLRFIGGLLSQLRLPVSIKKHHSSSSTEAEETKNLHHRIFDLLLSALNNIQREMQFFEDTAAQYGLELNMDAEMEPVTRSYVQMFDAVKLGGGSGGLVEGLTVLWATEHCYYTAWSHALSQKSPHSSANSSQHTPATHALHTAFIPNWTSHEFKLFVDSCRDVLNEAAAHEGLGTVIKPPPSNPDAVRNATGGWVSEEGVVVHGGKEEREEGQKGKKEDGQGGSNKEGVGRANSSVEEVLARCEGAWKQVLWLEERFWPDVE